MNIYRDKKGKMRPAQRDATGLMNIDKTSQKSKWRLNVLHEHFGTHLFCSHAFNEIITFLCVYLFIYFLSCIQIKVFWNTIHALCRDSSRFCIRPATKHTGSKTVTERAPYLLTCTYH